MATPRTKTRRTSKGGPKARPISVRARDRATGRVVRIGADRAYELFIGGAVGLWSLSHQLKMPDKIAAALFLVLQEAVKVATPPALVAVHRSLGGKPIPGENVLMDVSRETPRGNRRRKSPQLPATPRRRRG
jgi:hypothetical protein